MAAIDTFDELRREVGGLRSQLVSHRLYTVIETVVDVRVFMEHHVFAVWDFMSLVKTLQREFTCLDVPWVPRGDPIARRLVNEIVVGEESDDRVGGGYTSHFELYLAAMEESKADSAKIRAVVEQVARGMDVGRALVAADAPEPARRFVEATFATIASGSLPRIASAFTIGREEVIPDIFGQLVRRLSAAADGHLGLLANYLERHIHVDRERHAPMAARLLESLCGDSEYLWREALVGSREALVARRRFWDEIADEIARRKSSSAGAPHQPASTSADVRARPAARSP